MQLASNYQPLTRKPMQNVQKKIKELKERVIPKRYGWTATVGVSLKEIGFINIIDFLHHKRKVYPDYFPEDFDYEEYKKSEQTFTVTKYIDIDPELFIMAQAFLDKATLIRMCAGDKAYENVELIKWGRYYIVKNGHHRLAVQFMKGQRILADIIVRKAERSDAA